ncbi:MAG: sterol desaturase family protein [Nitrospirae bacterium]|nr:sterol desaturase family protein [Candidatus Troglogloeales bacterium]MBI3598961.1 sterol desaturase family protein [Candidatus Troglogloeales bacterium]
MGFLEDKDLWTYTTRTTTSLEHLSQIKTAIFLFALIVFHLIEYLFPFYLGRRKLSHDMRNLGLGVLNAIVLAPVFSKATLLVSQAAYARKYGLFNRIELPPFVEILVVFLLFDLWMYAWHRMNHKIPFLWRFHLVHHADPEVDASSALRFHTGEIFLSGMARLIIVLLLGLAVEQIILYETMLLPIILFHHSNINLMKKADQLIRILFVTPRLHWVHHSKIRDEMDTNYGSIFSFWDRIFRTIRFKQNMKEIGQGVDGIQEKESNSFFKMLRLPFSNGYDPCER